MKVVAAMNVGQGELSRYLTTTVPALLEWVDEVRVQDDLTTDGSYEYLESLDRVEVRRNRGSRWRENEGDLHAQLLDWTLESNPDFILAIDADELVVEGQAVRGYLNELGAEFLAFSLRMVELWGLEPPVARFDGGWRPHPVAILYRAPSARERRHTEWQIWGRKMAGGRVPRIIRSAQRRGRFAELPVDILHLGWSNPDERIARHRRYAELDGGKFHAGDHLDSILWPDDRCDLRPYDGPVPVAP